MHSGPYVSAVFTFVTEYSEESHSEMVKTPQGFGSLKCFPVPSKLHYDLIQGMHPKTLISIFCVNKPVANQFHVAMLQITDLGDNDMPIRVEFRRD